MALTKVIGAGAEGLTLSSTSLTVANGLTLTDGNVTLASGHGIDFTANTGQSGQSSEIFHHYEEGTWTPQIYSNVTQIATSSVYGFYTKIGDLVHINGQVSRNDSASLSSAFLLKNLPFTSKSGTGCVYVNGGFWFDKASATDEVGFGYMSGGSTTVYVKTLNLSAAYITADALENSRPVYFAFTYKTAT